MILDVKEPLHPGTHFLRHYVGDYSHHLYLPSSWENYLLFASLARPFEEKQNVLRALTGLPVLRTAYRRLRSWTTRHAMLYRFFRREYLIMNFKQGIWKSLAAILLYCLLI